MARSKTLTLFPKVRPIATDSSALQFGFRLAFPFRNYIEIFLRPSVFLRPPALYLAPLQLPDHRFADASHSRSAKSTAVLSRIFSSENSDPYTATTFSVLIVAYYSHILQFLLKYFILEFISMLLFVPCANSGIGVHPPRCVTTRNTILGKRKIF